MNVHNNSCLNSSFFKTILGLGTLITIGAIAVSIIGLTGSPQGPFNALVQLGKGINSALCGVSLFAFILELVGFSSICRKKEPPVYEPLPQPVKKSKPPVRKDSPRIIPPTNTRTPQSEVKQELKPPIPKPVPQIFPEIPQTVEKKEIKPPIPKQTHLPHDEKKLTEMEKAKAAFIKKANEQLKKKEPAEKTWLLDLDVIPIDSYTKIEATAKDCGRFDHIPKGMRGGLHFFMFELEEECPGLIFKKARTNYDFFKYSETAQTVFQLCAAHLDQLNLFQIPKFRGIGFANKVLMEEKIETNVKGPLNWPGIDARQDQKEIFKWIYKQEELGSYRRVLGLQLASLIYYGNFSSFNFKGFVVSNEGKIALIIDDLGSRDGYQQGWISFLENFSEVTTIDVVYYFIIDAARHYLRKTEEEMKDIEEELGKKVKELKQKRRNQNEGVLDVHQWFQAKGIKHPAQPIGLNEGSLFTKEGSDVRLADAETKRVARFLVKKINDELSPKTHWELVSERTLWFSPQMISIFAEELYPDDPKKNDKLLEILPKVLESLKGPGYIFKYILDSQLQHLFVIC